MEKNRHTGVSGSQMQHLKTVFLAFGFFALCFAAAQVAAAEVRDPEKYFFDETFWNFNEELETAREEGKKGILLMFEIEDCPFCARMKKTVLNRPDVQDYFKQNFLIFPVDIEGKVEVVDFKGRNMTMKDFASRQYRVRATPSYLFFDLDGNYIKRTRFTGATRNAEEFMLLGQYVVNQEYKNTNFSRYKRAHTKK